jgi:inorganic pyrophosphatase
MVLPDRHGGVLNCVIEIPRGTRAKMEIAVKEDGNPIVQVATLMQVYGENARPKTNPSPRLPQDTKKGQLRYYGIDPVFNYGAFPQVST